MDRALGMFKDVQPGKPGWFWIERISQITSQACLLEMVVREIVRDGSGNLWLDEHGQGILMTEEIISVVKGPVAPYVSGEVLPDTFTCGQCGWWAHNCGHGCGHHYHRMKAPTETTRACEAFSTTVPVTTPVARRRR